MFPTPCTRGRLGGMSDSSDPAWPPVWCVPRTTDRWSTVAGDPGHSLAINTMGSHTAPGLLPRKGHGQPRPISCVASWVILRLIAVYL